MSITSEIERIKANIANAYVACQTKGATMPSVLNSANLAECIASITGETSVTYKDYVDGATAIWTGEDGLNESNQWVDRISGYIFTPVSSSVVPVYDSSSKLLKFNAFGGMLSDFKPENIDYTMEIVLRDIPNITGGYGSGEGIISSTTHGTTGLNGFTMQVKPYTTINASQINSSRDSYSYLKADFETYKQYTFTTTPTEQIMNGTIYKTYNGTPVHTTHLGLGCRENDTTAQKTKFKIHCIRYYPFKLTSEQIAHNREVDIAIFGE